MLTPEASRILKLLIDALPQVIPARPDTYLGYKEIHDKLGLDYIGSTFGDSLKKQGLEALALWTVESGYPGITGLVVDKSTFQPGEGYFRVFGKTEDYPWWEEEVKKAKEFDWSNVQREIREKEGIETRLSAGSSYRFPSASDYLTAFEDILPQADAGHVAMLQAHFKAKDQTITARELAESAGYENFNAANLQYGLFAKKLCETLNFTPPRGNSGKSTPTFVIATAYQAGRKAEWTWAMRAPVVEALTKIWKNGSVSSDHGSIYSGDIPMHKTYTEGAALQVLVNRYERSAEARQACLDYWGAVCCVCDMDFEVVYGIAQNRGIHVHHLLPLSGIGGKYVIDPVHDLRPVCPNCHAALHSVDPPLALEVLRKTYRLRKNK